MRCYEGKGDSAIMTESKQTGVVTEWFHNEAKMACDRSEIRLRESWGECSSRDPVKMVLLLLLLLLLLNILLLPLLPTTFLPPS